jgi:hypothetical protein
LQKQSITVEQLRNDRAIAFCSRCSIRFDALERISDGEIGGEVVEAFPWQKIQRTKPPYWLFRVSGSGAGQLFSRPRYPFNIHYFGIGLKKSAAICIANCPPIKIWVN